MFKLLSCYLLPWELIEFLKALEVPLLAVRLGFESEEAEHVGKCFHCVIFFSHLVTEWNMQERVEWDYKYCNNVGNACMAGVGMKFGSLVEGWGKEDNQNDSTMSMKPRVWYRVQSAFKRRKRAPPVLAAIKEFFYPLFLSPVMCNTTRLEEKRCSRGFLWR